jgi:hypothetical protein
MFGEAAVPSDFYGVMLTPIDSSIVLNVSSYSASLGYTVTLKTNHANNEVTIKDNALIDLFTVWPTSTPTTTPIGVGRSMASSQTSDITISFDRNLTIDISGTGSSNSLAPTTTVKLQSTASTPVKWTIVVPTSVSATNLYENNGGENGANGTPMTAIQKESATTGDLVFSAETDNTATTIAFGDASTSGFSLTESAAGATITLTREPDHL